MEQLENEVFLYCEEHDDVDLTVLANQFGTPEELASDFLPEINVDTFSGFVKLKHFVLLSLVAIVVMAILAASGATIYFRYKQEQIMDGQYIEVISYEGDDTSYITGPTIYKEDFP